MRHDGIPPITAKWSSQRCQTSATQTLALAAPPFTFLATFRTGDLAPRVAVLGTPEGGGETGEGIRVSAVEKVDPHLVSESERCPGMGAESVEVLVARGTNSSGVSDDVMEMGITRVCSFSIVGDSDNATTEFSFSSSMSGVVMGSVITAVDERADGVGPGGVSDGESTFLLGIGVEMSGVKDVTELA